MFYKALTPQTWQDFETLFGEKGACGGCWCMHWRIARKESEAGKGEGNRLAMKSLVDKGLSTGLLLYTSDKEVIAWISLGPREDFISLKNSRILKPVDDKKVWSIACFFIKKEYRQRGVSVRLIESAIVHAKKNGARILEAYPVEPKKDKAPDVFVWTGLAKSFIKAGFDEVARRSETRPIMRLMLSDV